MPRGDDRRPKSRSGRSAPAPKTSGKGAPKRAPAGRSPGAGPTGARTAGARAGGGRAGGGRTPTSVAPARKADKGLGGEQVEGRQAVRELLIAGVRKVREVWVVAETDDDRGDDARTPRRTGTDDIVELARDQRVTVQYVNRRRLEAAARSEAPQGVIAFAAPLPEAQLDTLVKRRSGRPPFLVAVDGVTDPGNLGALLRCCDGAGVDGVVLPRHRAVHVTPTVAKAAAGAVEHVPLAVVGGLPAALARMKDAGIWIVGLDDAADRTLFDIGDLAREAVCLVLGAEGAGLSRLVRERCDLIVSIPMLGRLSSLNVSAAAALGVYEVRRHRIG
jgi:23S rRNA (guanosine2251-2'-O)-methyltransferase